MNRKAVIVGALVLVAGGVLATRARWFKAPTPLLIRVERAPFREVVELRGHIEPQRFEDIQSPTVKVERQLIQVADEGALVKAGDVIAKFDPGPLLLYIDSLKERLRDLEMSKEDLEVLMDSRIFEQQVGVRSTHQDLILAEIRKETLGYEAGLRKAGATVQVNLAKQSVKSYQGRLGLTVRQKKTRVADRVEDAKRFLERIGEIEAQLEEFTLRAKADSVVVYPVIPVAGDLRKVAAGDYLDRGQSFLQLPELSSLVVRGYLDESQVQRVKPGLQASIRPVALPDVKLTGEVLSVSRVATLLPGRGQRQFFEMLIRNDPATQAAALKVGMVVGISVLVKDHGQIFAVPRDLATPDPNGWSVKLYHEHAAPERLALNRVIENGDHLLVAEWPGGEAGPVRLVYEPNGKK